jgi:alkylation response protein AidB-like acyl-CoA dehydrogenase
VSFSEASSGAQFMRPSTVARPTETSYILSGRKAFCTSAGAAQYVIISTLLEPDQATLFIVEPGRAGLTVAPTWDAMGMRASASHDLVLELLLSLGKEYEQRGMRVQKVIL